MSVQGFASISNQVFTTAPAALVATTEEALVPTLYTGIAAAESYGGKVWELVCGGIWTTAATGALTLTPRVGLTSGGITLGASAAITVPVSITNIPWRLEFTLQCRSLGLAGANSTYIGTGHFITEGVTTAAFTVVCGGTQASADGTIATGLWMGKTLSVAGSMTTQYSSFRPWN